MRKRPRSQMIPSQRSISYYGSEVLADDPYFRRRPLYQEASQSYMLADRTRLGLWPIGEYSRKRQCEVTLSPRNERWEGMIAEALSADSYRHDLSPALFEFLGNCAVNALMYGDAPHEIVYLQEQADQPATMFRLAYIMPGTVRKRFGHLVQYVPRSIAAARSVPQNVRLDTDTILNFTLPPSLRREVGQAMDCLLSLSRIFPDFAFPTADRTRKTIPFDASAFRRSQSLALADAGRSIGWDAGGLFAQDITEFYYMLRFLRFERFKVALRASLLATLNDGLVRAGSALGFRGEISVTGLPTTSEIDAAEAELRSGGIPFSEIIQRFQL